MGGREGVEVIVESEVVCRCFLGVFGGILAVKCHDSNVDLLDTKVECKFGRVGQAGAVTSVAVRGNTSEIAPINDSPCHLRFNAT